MENNLNKKLIMAVKIGYLEGVQRLLIEGANPNWKDEDGASALDWIILFTDNRIAKALNNSIAPYKENKDKYDEAVKSTQEYFNKMR